VAVQHPARSNRRQCIEPSCRSNYAFGKRALRRQDRVSVAPAIRTYGIMPIQQALWRATRPISRSSERWNSSYCWQSCDWAVKGTPFPFVI
jgi:hypothetical protein